MMDCRFWNSCVELTPKMEPTPRVCTRPYGTSRGVSSIVALNFNNGLWNVLKIMLVVSRFDALVPNICIIFYNFIFPLKKEWLVLRSTGVGSGRDEGVECIPMEGPGCDSRRPNTFSAQAFFSLGSIPLGQRTIFFMLTMHFYMLTISLSNLLSLYLYILLSFLFPPC